ncbi:hypothetical protein FL863_06510 [Listeria monocytogenes]|nr:hypothetical protein [Listeria monocytogenes]
MYSINPLSEDNTLLKNNGNIYYLPRFYPGRGSRDAERFVRGSDGSLYYTKDHYKSVVKVE